MNTSWIKLEDRKPNENGKYIVCYANPYYTNEPMCIDIKWFSDGFFNDEVSGVNYIAYWLDNLELPELSREERNKRVSKPQSGL